MREARRRGGAEGHHAHSRGGPARGPGHCACAREASGTSVSSCVFPDWRPCLWASRTRFSGQLCPGNAGVLEMVLKHFLCWTLCVSHQIAITKEVQMSSLENHIPRGAIAFFARKPRDPWKSLKLQSLWHLHWLSLPSVNYKASETTPPTPNLTLKSLCLRLVQPVCSRDRPQDRCWRSLDALGAGLSSSWGGGRGGQTSYSFPEVLSTTLCPQGQGAPERKAGSTFPALPDLAQGQVWT